VPGGFVIGTVAPRASAGGGSDCDLLTTGADRRHDTRLRICPHNASMVHTGFILTAGTLALRSRADHVCDQIMLLLIALIGMGMLTGSDGLGLVEFGDFGLAQEMGIVAPQSFRGDGR
jgi:hypothetical protein